MQSNTFNFDFSNQSAFQSCSNVNSYGEAIKSAEKDKRPLQPMQSNSHITTMPPQEQTKSTEQVLSLKNAIASGSQIDSNLLKENEDKSLAIDDDVETIEGFNVRIVPRDKSENFTEYLFSKPTCFMHRCEDVMAGSSTLALMCGMAGAVILGNPEFIPSNEKIALGCFGAMGICLAGTVLTGITGGIGAYFTERKNRLMQERMARTRD